MQAKDKRVRVAVKRRRLHARTRSIFLDDAIDKFCFYGVYDEVGCARDEVSVSKNCDSGRVFHTNRS